jgi:hypothetical protein
LFDGFSKIATAIAIDLKKTRPGQGSDDKNLAIKFAIN